MTETVFNTAAFDLRVLVPCLSGTCAFPRTKTSRKGTAKTENICGAKATKRTTSVCRLLSKSDSSRTISLRSGGPARSRSLPAGLGFVWRRGA